MTRAIVLFGLLSFSHFIHAQDGEDDDDDELISCYAVNGALYPNQVRCPGSDACCGPNATCLSNRLCSNPGEASNVLVRGPCRSKSFGSGECPRICLSEEDTGFFPRVTIRPDGSLCCQDRPRCCNDNEGVFLDIDGEPTDSSPSVTYAWGPDRSTNPVPTVFYAATTSSAPSETPTTTSRSVSTSLPQDQTTTSMPPAAATSTTPSSSDSMSLKIGLGVGISAAAIAGAVAAFWFWRRRRTRRSASDPAQHGPARKPPYTLTDGATYGAPLQKPYAKAELQGSGHYTTPGPVELAAN